MIYLKIFGLALFIAILGAAVFMVAENVFGPVWTFATAALIVLVAGVVLPINQMYKALKEGKQ